MVWGVLRTHKGLPNLPNSADTLGWAYYQQGAYNAAIALQINPKISQADEIKKLLGASPDPDK